MNALKECRFDLIDILQKKSGDCPRTSRYQRSRSLGSKWGESSFEMQLSCLDRS